MRRIATYIFLTTVFAAISAAGADGQDTITDRPAVLAADIRDLAQKAYLYGLIDKDGRDSLATEAERESVLRAIPELEAIRAQWEDSLSFMEKLDYDGIIEELTSDMTDRKTLAERMLPALLAIPEMKERFGPLTVEEALARIDELLGRDLAYEKKMASMSKAERAAWTIARMLFGGSAAYKPDAIPMMNGLWYMPIPPGEPESFDETIFRDKNFDPNVYKTSIPEPVYNPEDMLRRH